MSDEGDRGWWTAFCEWASKHGINPRDLDSQRTKDAKSLFRQAFKMAREAHRTAPYTEEYQKAKVEGFEAGFRKGCEGRDGDDPVLRYTDAITSIRALHLWGYAISESTLSELEAVRAQLESESSDV